MTKCQATVLIGQHGEQCLCMNEATARVYIDGELDRVINVCPTCEAGCISSGATPIPKMNAPEMLKGVLGGNISLGIEGGCFTLFCNTVAFVNPTILCQHKNWEVFMVLCSEYSDYVAGEELTDG